MNHFRFAFGIHFLSESKFGKCKKSECSQFVQILTLKETDGKNLFTERFLDTIIHRYNTMHLYVVCIHSQIIELY